MVEYDENDSDESYGESESYGSEDYSTREKFAEELVDLNDDGFDIL